MARLAGIDLPRQKRVIIALTYIFGIGPTIAEEIITKIKMSPDTRVKDLSEGDIVKLREIIRDYATEGDLRRRVNQDIKRLMDVGSYRGQRHKKRLPARGQRTHTNARTRKGKAVAIAGKKMATK